MTIIYAVDAWQSVGSFPIQDPASAISSMNGLWSQLEMSAVGQNNSHPKAVEFAFDNGDGTTHWIALPISNGPKIIREKLEAALMSFCNWRRAT